MYGGARLSRAVTTTIVKMKSTLLFLACFAAGLAAAQSGDLILFIGQSNMAGRAAIDSDTLALDNVMLLNYEGTFEPAHNPLNRFSTIRKNRNDLQRLSIAYSFCEEVVNTADDSLFIAVQARGGTAIEKFMKGSDWGYYEATVNRVTNALAIYPDLRLRAVLVHQGEANLANPKEYLEKLHLVITTFRADLKDPDLPFVLGELGPWNTETQGIRTEMRKIPETIPFAYLVSSEGLTNQDAHHFDRESVLAFGRRYAEIYLKLRKDGEVE